MHEITTSRSISSSSFLVGNGFNGWQRWGSTKGSQGNIKRRKRKHREQYVLLIVKKQ